MTEKKEIRWGLLGAGQILLRWMNGARQVDGMTIVAISSRTRERAEGMRQKFQIPEALTYEELLGREDIDVVYIPVPHPAHKELALKAMNAGKAVLVEKPATVNAADFQELMACAEKNNVFLMEAVWTRFFPMVKKIRELICEDGIGEVRAVHTAFSSRISGDMPVRLTDPGAAGGGLLDTGVYNFHFTDMILDKDPVALTGLASFDTDDLHLQVDEQASYVAQYDRGELAVMTSGIRTEMPQNAYIYGTRGFIEVPIFWKPTRMNVTIGSRTFTVECPVEQRVPGPEDEGYQYEIEYVNQCLRQGRKKPEIMTWEKSLSVLRQCDWLRKQWGFRFPFE